MERPECVRTRSILTLHITSHYVFNGGVCVRKICIIYDFMTLWMMFADHYGAVRFHVLALFSGEFLHHFDAFDCGCFCACQLRCSLVARTLATPATAQKRLSRAKAGSHKIVLANARFARPSCP